MSQEKHAAIDATTSTSERSSEQKWVVIHYRDDDPNEQFEIVESSRVASKSQRILKPLMYVSVRYGNVRLLGSVVDIFDDYNYVKENFEQIKKKFLQDYPEGVKPRRAFCPVSKKPIEMIEREVQTDVDWEIPASQRRCGRLQELCNGNELERNSLVHNRLARSTEINKRSKAQLRRNLVSKSARAFPRKRRAAAETKSRPSSEQDDDQMVTIGSNNTRISRKFYKTIRWESHTSATKKLLILLFDRETLATHTLTGKRSPAFPNNPVKKGLDPKIVSDIVEHVSRKCRVPPKAVRLAVTSKCADETKLMRKRDNPENEKKEEAGCSTRE